VLLVLPAARLGLWVVLSLTTQLWPAVESSESACVRNVYVAVVWALGCRSMIWRSTAYASWE